MSQMAGNQVLCRCRDESLRESGCPVHGPWVPSAVESRSHYAALSLSILDIAIKRLNRAQSIRNNEMIGDILSSVDRGKPVVFRRYSDLDGNAVGNMRRVPVLGVD